MTSWRRGRRASGRRNDGAPRTRCPTFLSRCTRRIGTRDRDSADGRVSTAYAHHPTSSLSCRPEMSGIALRRSARVFAAAPTVLASRTTSTVASNAADTNLKRSTEELSELSDLDSEASSPRPAKRQRTTGKAAFKRSQLLKQVASQDTATTQPDAGPSEPGRKPKKRARKEPAAEPKPEHYMTRFFSSWKVGPHVSAAGGVENAIVNAASVG